LRKLARMIRDCREAGASSQEIARILRQAADDLDGKNPA
jgi:hypothetical protein